ncbi:MAG: hypothetical protein Q4E45_06270 [Eubacteriales bacterium]|nr:hypothetical protein [Eubacteriales bacterium]
MVIRLVVASVIFAVALILTIPTFLRILLLVISAGLAGYDIILKAVDCILNGDYFASPVLLILISVLAFFVGFATEGAALILLYQIGLLLLKFTKEHTKKAALDLVQGRDEDVIAHMRELAGNEESCSMAIENVMRSSAGTILRLAMLFAVVYAIALPLFTSFGFLVSIHRALIILLIATPMSVVASIPVAGLVGLCSSASHGLVFNNAYSMEAMADASVAVIDKSGVFTDECPRVISMYSDVLDQETFLNFVAHAVYYSEQPVANAISAVFDRDYRLDVIKDFREIPGYGVELSIDGIPVTFATAEYLRGRGLDIDESGETAGQTFYMVVAGRKMGKVVISSDINSDLENLVPELKAAGIGRCILLCEDGKEVGQAFAEDMNFSEMYAQCTPEKKLDIVDETTRKTKGAVLFLYSNGMEQHSSAAVDIRVSKRAKYADAVVSADELESLPIVKQISRRVREICIENALFAFIVKSVLIFLSIIGYCNLWLAVVLDFATAIATVLNTIRITGPSLRANLRYKFGK